MHLMKPEGPHRPGRSVFSWHSTEAKVNSQFPGTTRASAYLSTGPPSRPISQESLHHWERAAREDRRYSYLDFVKNGVKQDTMNLLRNAPLFGYGLFPDAAIVTAEQDITKS